MDTERSCCYCGGEVPADRPYDHCTRGDCVYTYLHERRSQMAIELVPKQGFTYVRLDQIDPTASGRSSGR